MGKIFFSLNCLFLQVAVLFLCFGLLSHLSQTSETPHASLQNDGLAQLVEEPLLLVSLDLALGMFRFLEKTILIPYLWANGLGAGVLEAK